MIRTVSEAFDKLKTSCEPTLPAKELISARQAHLRRSLGEKIDIVEDFLTGSYVKQTQIRPPTDVDVFIVLSPTYWHERNLQTPQKVLPFVKRNLKKTYPSTTMKLDNQAIKLIFTDGIKFDVVPGFQGQNDLYFIPNLKTRLWIHCNPKINISLLSDSNKIMDMKLKPLIKMVKCWRATQHVKLTSFHLELLVVESFKGLAPEELRNILSSYPRALSHFFYRACLLIGEPMFDEVEERVDTYLDTVISRHLIWKKLQNASQKSLEACFWQNMHHDTRAISMWKGLFGRYFPIRSQ